MCSVLWLVLKIKTRFFVINKTENEEDDVLVDRKYV